MQVATQFYKKRFKAATSKEAYLKACKWVAINIVSKEAELSDVFWRTEKVVDPNSDLPAIDLRVFTLLNENETSKNFCDSCKEFHNSFFINENFNCDRCNKETYRKRLEQRLSIKRTFKRERMQYITGQK